MIGDPVTYIFIDDLLEYMDVEYEENYFNTVGTINRLNSLLKKIFIKTDYFLTKDETIIEHINNNMNYGNNDYAVSSGMLDEIVSLKDINREAHLKKIRSRNMNKDN